MDTALSLSLELHRELVAHLEQGKEEQVAFLFAEPPGEDGRLRATEMYAVPPQDFVDQSAFYLALSDEVRGLVISRATRLGACLVEAHSHLHGPAGFSPTDIDGLEEWVPHVRWRLAGRPYLALVFAGERFDALVWGGGGAEPGPLAELAVDGEPLRRPTGITLGLLSRRP